MIKTSPAEANAKNRTQPNFPHSTPISAIELTSTFTMLVGEIPREVLVERLGISEASQYKAIERLKRKKQVALINRDGIKGIQAKEKLRKQLHTENPARYIIMNEKRNYNDIINRIRRHKSSYSLITMYKCGFEIFTDRKPFIFYGAKNETAVGTQRSKEIAKQNEIFKCETLPKRIKIATPLYYTSREVKNIGKTAAKYKGSRCRGILFCDKASYSIFCGEDDLKNDMKKNEERLYKDILRGTISTRIERRYNEKTVKSIILYKENKYAEKINEQIKYEKGKKRNNVTLCKSDIYKDCFLLPMNNEGDKLLQFLADEDERAKVYKTLLQDYYPLTEKYPYQVDAEDKKGNPVMFFFEMNGSRIYHLKNLLSRESFEKVTVVCLEWQREILKEYYRDNEEVAVEVKNIYQ